MYRVPAQARRDRVLPLRAAAAVAALVLLAVAVPAALAQHGPAPAPAHQVGGEANLVLPVLDRWPGAADGRPGRLRARPAVRPGASTQQRQEAAGAQVDARDLRADLRDLQDLPDHAGQVPAHPLGSSSARSSSLYFGVLQHFDRAARCVIILLFSLVGIAGSYGVAWFGIRINTFANSRTAFASLRGQALPDATPSRCRPA